MIKQCFTAYSLMIYYSYLNSFPDLSALNRHFKITFQVYLLSNALITPFSIVLLWSFNCEYQISWLPDE